MRLVVLFSCILFLGCAVKSAHQATNNVPKTIIQLIFMYIELALQHLGSVNIPINKTLPVNFLASNILEGDFGLQKLRISGFDTLVVNKDNINFDIKDSVFSFCLNMSVPKDLKLTLADYEADIALFDVIPVYGRGDISLGLKGIDFALCSDIHLTPPIQLSNFVLQPYANGLIFELEGFWNNPELSGIISALVSTLENVVFFFYKDNMQCISCMLSMSIENIINYILKPLGEPIDYYALGALSRTNCKAECSFTGYPLIQKMFNMNSTAELFNFIEKDETIRNYILEAKDLLNQYLEEQI